MQLCIFMSFPVVSSLDITSDDMLPLAYLTPAVHHDTSPTFNVWQWGNSVIHVCKKHSSNHAGCTQYLKSNHDSLNHNRADSDCIWKRKNGLCELQCDTIQWIKSKRNESVLNFLFCVTWNIFYSWINLWFTHEECLNKAEIDTWDTNPWILENTATNLSK